MKGAKERRFEDKTDEFKALQEVESGSGPWKDGH